MNNPSPSDDDLDPKPEIQQHVTGDRNHVIGRVDKSLIIQNPTINIKIQNLTIYERIPLESVLTSRSTGQALKPKEYRQRKILLNKVKEFWVTGVLETSLYKRILIELGQKERPDLVQRPFSSVGEFAESTRQTLPDGSNITTYFDRMETGRTLLIVGEPGSGKTITLLKLAEDLIARTEQDLLQPMPVVFNLSSWARKLQSIEDWLLQELLEKYHVPTAFGKAWVESESLILLVDGLDEVKAEHRNACVQGLNKFLQNHGSTDLIVCCRIKDYQLLDNQLTLRQAIFIQPLNSEQITDYLNLAGNQLAALKAILLNNSELSTLATSPLILSIMSLTYQGCSLEMPQQLIQQEHQYRKLFDAYIERMFDRRKTLKHTKIRKQKIG
jgi:NACHT domain